MGTDLTPITAAAHVFVTDLAAPEPDEPDSRHLTRVLRLRPGAGVTVADGLGSWRPCTLQAGGRLRPIGDVVVEPPPTPELTVAFALVKGQRPELVVEKLTELGVDRIVPFVAERSVVRWDDTKAGRRRERFTDIARQAASQCRRSRLPAIGLAGGVALGSQGAPSFTDVVAALPGAVMADREGAPPSPGMTTVLIGPEGGWTEAERRAVPAPVRVGCHVLRAETAAITTGALLVALRGDIVAPLVAAQVTDFQRS